MPLLDGRFYSAKYEMRGWLGLLEGQKIIMCRPMGLVKFSGGPHVHPVTADTTFKGSSAFPCAFDILNYSTPLLSKVKWITGNFILKSTR